MKTFKKRGRLVLLAALAIAAAAGGSLVNIGSPPAEIGQNPAPSFAESAPIRLRGTVKTTPAETDSVPSVGKTDKDAEFAKFRREITNLIDACTKKPPCDERQLLLDQAGLGFDTWLGFKHPRRAELLDVTAWSYDERQVLAAQFAAKTLTRVELFQRLSEHFAEKASRFGALLTDQEYRLAFETEKGVNPAELLDLTPEKARQLDEESKAP